MMSFTVLRRSPLVLSQVAKFSSLSTSVQQQQQQQQSSSSSSSSPFLSDSLVRNHTPEQIQAYSEKLKTNPKYFANIPLDSLEFRVVSNPATGGYVPGLFVKDEVKSGVKHITPVSRVTLSHITPDGNLGRNKYNSKETITDPKEAEYQIIINASPVFPEESHNAEFTAYAAWLRAIRQKFIQHLATNIDSYASIKKKCRGQPADKFKDIIDLSIPQLTRVDVKEPKDDYTAFKTRTFYTMKEGVVKDSSFVVPGDKELFAQHKLRRMNIHLYDATGKEFPWDQRDIKHGDVVVVEGNLQPIVFDAASMGSIRRQLNSVMLLNKEQSSPSSKPNPFF